MFIAIVCTQISSNLHPKDTELGISRVHLVPSTHGGPQSEAKISPSVRWGDDSIILSSMVSKEFKQRKGTRPSCRGRDAKSKGEENMKRKK